MKNNPSNLLIRGYYYLGIDEEYKYKINERTN